MGIFTGGNSAEECELAEQLHKILQKLLFSIRMENNDIMRLFYLLFFFFSFFRILWLGSYRSCVITDILGVTDEIKKSANSSGYL